jgi:hypothetical protein
MSEYKRTTRACPLSQIPSEPLKALRDYFKEHKLGDLDTEILACCETVSELVKENKLLAWLEGERDKVIHSWILLTSKRVVWVRSGDQSGLVTNTAELTQVRVRKYKAIFSRDTGLELFGFIGIPKTRLRGYLGMGTEPAAEEFFELLSDTITELQPPKEKRGWLRWFSRD